jgi:hypothetical protein
VAEDERTQDGRDEPETHEEPVAADEPAGAGEGPRMPTEDELRAALDRVTVADLLLPTLASVASVGFHKLTPEARDLPQARLAIETLRALEPVLREGGVDEAVVRDLEQARANLQLAFAKAVSETAGAAEERTDAGGEETPLTGEPEPAGQPEGESES